MPHPPRLLPLALATTLAVGLTGLAAAPAQAATDHLVINEFYGRGGSANQPYATKFVELYNPTGAAIQLTGMSLQYRSASGTANGSAAALTGSVPAGGYFVVATGSNGTTGAALPQVDQTTTLNPSGTAGTVYLASTTTAINPDSQAAQVVDKLGYGSSNSPETTPALYGDGTTTPANNVPGSLGRSKGVDTDNNAADFSFATTPTPGAANAGGSGGTDPEPTPEPTPELTTIAAIQGTGTSSPLVGQKVTTKGVVTAAYPTGGFNGFYLQTPGSGGTAKSPGDASDGVFVFGSTKVEVGSCYTVTATVTEFQTMTELTQPTITPASGCDPVKVTPLATLPKSDAAKEVYEGMLVKPQGTYTITNNYDLNTYGQLGLAEGTKPLYTPTDVVRPEQAAAFEAEQVKRYITLDDGSSWNYMTNATAKNSPLPYLSQATPMRTNSQVTFSSPVILDYRFQWNFQPTHQVVGAQQDVVTSENDRPATPPNVGGDIQIATFNVLNYFTDLGQDEPGCKAYTDREGTPVASNNCQVRGAYTPSAFKDQQTKIVNAINGLNAEVVALMEVENSAGITWINHDRDYSLAQLVDALNASGDGQWDYVPSPVVNAPNEDVIRTAFIYKVDAVKPLGASVIDLDPAFANARYPLGQRFKQLKGGTQFVTVANHFKSKGSGVDDGTGQGLSNPSREAQARAVTSWAKEIWPSKPVFLMGDFNAYSKETPVQIIEAAGYTEAVKASNPDATTTYQFGGRLGSLDHIFANAEAMKLVTGGGVWDINADESVAMQYSRRNYNIVDFYTTKPDAASDHDPALVGIRFKK